MIGLPYGNSFLAQRIIDQVIVEHGHVFDAAQVTGILMDKLLADQNVIRANLSNRSEIFGFMRYRIIWIRIATDINTIQRGAPNFVKKSPLPDR